MWSKNEFKFIAHLSSNKHSKCWRSWKRCKIWKHFITSLKCSAMKNQNNIKVQAFSMNIENLLLVVQNNKKDGNSTSVRYLTEEYAITSCWCWRDNWDIFYWEEPSKMEIRNATRKFKNGNSLRIDNIIFKQNF